MAVLDEHEAGIYELKSCTKHILLFYPIETEECPLCKAMAEIVDLKDEMADLESKLSDLRLEQ